MRGHFALTSPPEAIRRNFGYRETPDFPPRADIAATKPIAIVAALPFTGGQDRRFLLVRWGFVPSFATDLESLPPIAYARAESVAEKPIFAAAFRRRRCLVPADGFYVGSREGAFLVTRADGAPIGVAGVYETYLDPNGSEIDSACLITTGANAILAPFGERAPAMLPEAAYTAWLDHEATSPSAAQALLRPAPDDELRLTPVAAQAAVTIR
jgi:putative SOS response-associated peptidase YedK